MIYIFASSIMYCVLCRKNLWTNAPGEHWFWENYPKSKLHHFWRHWRITKTMDLSPWSQTEGKYKGQGQTCITAFSHKSLANFPAEGRGGETGQHFLWGWGPWHWSWGASRRRGLGKQPSWDPCMLISILDSQTRSYVKCLYLYRCVCVYTQAHTFISELKQK